MNFPRRPKPMGFSLGHRPSYAEERRRDRDDRSGAHPTTSTLECIACHRTFSAKRVGNIVLQQQLCPECSRG